MANWDRTYSNGTYYNHWIGRLIYNLDSQDVGGNSSHISLYLQTFSDSGAYSQNGSWDPRIYLNGGQVTAPGGSYNIGSSPAQIASWGGTVGHDANGNCYLTLGDYINAPINEMTRADIGWTLPRIPLAPGFAAVIADTIKPTTARLGVEITGFGHGTSAAMRTNIRLQGTSTWTPLGDQGDVAGYNYWTATGLKPGKTYEYYATVWNNNGDTTDSGIQTFKTKGIAGLAPLLMSLAA